MVAQVVTSVEFISKWWHKSWHLYLEWLARCVRRIHIKL